MGRNAFTSTAGTRLFYDVLGGLGFATQIGVGKYKSLPGGNDRKETDTTRDDQVLDDLSPDFVEQTEMTYVDPGAMEIEAHGEVDINAWHALDDGVRRSWKILFNSGSYYTFDGVVQKVGPTMEDRGKLMADVKIRAASQKVFHKVG